MAKAITKQEAIKRLHINRSHTTLKVLDWIKLPEKCRMIVYETRTQDIVELDKNIVETRAHIYPAEGGGAGVIIANRREPRK